MKVVISSFSPNDYLRPATLVFDSLRVGFPTSSIDCYWNGYSPLVESEVRHLCKKNDVRLFTKEQGATNDKIGNIVLNHYQGKVVLIDSDVMFWSSIENLEQNELLFGRYIPTHLCPFTKILTKERLHPSLLFIKDIDTLHEVLLKSPIKFTPIDYCSPFVVFEDKQPIFYDSFSNLYQAIGGERFTDKILDKYDHLFCSSFVDNVSKTKGLEHLSSLHNEIYKNPLLLKGRWKEQEIYFDKYKVI